VLKNPENESMYKTANGSQHHQNGKFNESISHDQVLSKNNMGGLTGTQEKPTLMEKVTSSIDDVAKNVNLT